MCKARCYILHLQSFVFEVWTLAILKRNFKQFKVIY